MTVEWQLVCDGSEGQVETDETENWNGKLKAETESGKLERKTES